MSKDESISDLIRQEAEDYLSKKDNSYQDLANLSGLPKSTLYNFVRDGHDMTGDKLTDLARALNIGEILL